MHIDKISKNSTLTQNIRKHFNSLHWQPLKFLILHLSFFPFFSPPFLAFFFCSLIKRHTTIFLQPVKFLKSFMNIEKQFEALFKNCLLVSKKVFLFPVNASTERIQKEKRVNHTASCNVSNDILNVLQDNSFLTPKKNFL